MLQITKYLIISVILVHNRNIQATLITDDCDTSHSENTGYFAEGSAHSSQFVLPDGSLITSSKGSSISSDGIQKTFHELKKEADKFVSKTGEYSFDSSINLPHLPQSLNIPFTQKQFFSDVHSGAEQKAFSQSQSGNSAHFFSQQYQPVLPQTSKVTSFTQEQNESQKKVVNTKNTAVYPNPNTELEIEQQNKGANSNTFMYQPNIPNTQQGYEFNQKQGSESFHMSKMDSIPIVQKSPDIPLLSPGKSYSSASSSGKQEQNFFSNLQPNTFNTGIIDINSLVGRYVPSKVTESKSESPYYSESEEIKKYNENTFVHSNQKEVKLNAIPITKIPNTVKFASDDINQINTDEYVVKPIPGAQYEKNQNEEYPTSKFMISVQAPATASETFQKTSSLSSHAQTVTSNSQQVPLETGVGSHFINQVQVANIPGATYSLQKETSSSLRNSSVIHSPMPLGAVSQGVHYDSRNTQYGQSSDNINTPTLTQSIPSYYEGKSSDAVNIPVLVHGVPQTFVANKKSSSSSHFFTSNGQVNSDRFVPNSELFVDQAGSNFLQSGSSVLDKLSNFNSNSNSQLCTACASGFSSSNMPVKKSYGISTSYSSSSSNMNGQKSENRQASISVNDNGKVDTYNVKSP